MVFALKFGRGQADASLNVDVAQNAIVESGQVSVCR